MCLLFPRCVQGGFIIASMGVYEGGLLLPPWVCMRGVYYCLHGCVRGGFILMPGCVRGGFIDAWVCTRGVY